MKKKEPGADVRVARTVRIVDEQELRKMKADTWLAKRIATIAFVTAIAAMLLLIPAYVSLIYMPT